MTLCYLNNAASTFPKPPEVGEALRRCLSTEPREPGRGSQSDDPTIACRVRLAELWGLDGFTRVILTPSATVGLNLAILGLLHERKPATIVTSTLEHNSVLRPIESLRSRGWKVHFLRPDADGLLDPEPLRREWPADTRLLALTHCSNVTGAVQSLTDFAVLAADHGCPFLIDASQSAGVIPLALSSLPGSVFLAFAGHKGLYGPAGTGGLILPDGVALRPLWYGGTGIRSESLEQPDELPIRYEAGTPNLPGIAGLTAGLEFVCTQGVDALARHRAALVARFRELLSDINGITLAPLAGDDGRAGIVAFQMAGFPAAELAFALRQAFDIEIRGGLHCAPLIHQEAGLWPGGCARASVGAFSDQRDVDTLARALRHLGERPHARS